MKNLSLKVLGNEYISESKKIRNRIRELRIELKNLSGKRREEMNRRISSLYDSAREANATGNYLFNYYGEEK